MATTKLKIRNDLVLKSKKNEIDNLKLKPIWNKLSKVEQEKEFYNLIKDVETTIYVQYCNTEFVKDKKTGGLKKADRFKLFNTGKKIQVQYWDEENECVKRSFKGYTTLNAVIENKRQEIEEIVKKAQFVKIQPTIEYVEDEYNKLSSPDIPEINKDFFKLYDAFMEERKGVKAYNTNKQHRTLYNNLKAFQADTKYKITLDSIDHNFYDKLVAWLINVKGHNPNSIGDSIKNLKIFLGDLTDKKINTNLIFRDKKFKKPSAPVEIITLTQSELDNLFILDLSKNKRLEKIRDLFVLGCTTGLRFSDLANLKPENIKDDIIDLTTVKTKDRLEVPINAYTRQILDKYNGILPKVPSNQKMNDYLKEVGEKAGISELVQRVKYVGATRAEYNVPKYELLSTHAARRTFVTLSLEGGMSHKEIMEITGHKNIKTMLKYQNVTKKAAKVAMLRTWGNAPAIMKVG